jgi:hypothetical protein
LWPRLELRRTALGKRLLSAKNPLVAFERARNGAPACPIPQFAVSDIAQRLQSAGQQHHQRQPKYLDNMLLSTLQM